MNPSDVLRAVENVLAVAGRKAGDTSEDQQILVEGREALIALASRFEPVAVGPGWHAPDLVPPVPAGSCRTFILAVFRAEAGTVFTFPAAYLKAMPLLHEDGCEQCDWGGKPCPFAVHNGCEKTGWYHDEPGEEGDGRTFYEVTLRNGDLIKGWCEVPVWEVGR